MAASGSVDSRFSLTIVVFHCIFSFVFLLLDTITCRLAHRPAVCRKGQTSCVREAAGRSRLPVICFVLKPALQDDPGPSRQLHCQQRPTKVLLYKEPACDQFFSFRRLALALFLLSALRKYAPLQGRPSPSDGPFLGEFDSSPQSGCPACRCGGVRRRRRRTEDLGCTWVQGHWTVEPVALDPLKVAYRRLTELLLVSSVNLSRLKSFSIGAVNLLGHTGAWSCPG